MNKLVNRKIKELREGRMKKPIIGKKYRPITKRYCVKCAEIKNFELNKNIGHSECMNCGARFAVRKPKRIKQSIDKEYQKRKEEIQKKEEEVEKWYEEQLKSLEKYKLYLKKCEE